MTNRIGKLMDVASGFPTPLGFIRPFFAAAFALTGVRPVEIQIKKGAGIRKIGAECFPEMNQIYFAEFVTK